MYVILNFQRCTVGMQKLVCIHKDTDTWLDILYRRYKHWFLFKEHLEDLPIIVPYGIVNNV